MDADHHAADLHRAYTGHDALWDYLPYGPFSAAAAADQLRPLMTLSAVRARPAAAAGHAPWLPLPVEARGEIRAAFGNSIEFGLDFHGRVAAPMAKVLLRELELFPQWYIAAHRQVTLDAAQRKVLADVAHRLFGLDGFQQIAPRQVACLAVQLVVNDRT